MTYFLLQIINAICTVYSWLIIVTIASSWFPSLQNYHIVSTCTAAIDPILSRIRSIIPPIGGVIDLSPLIALFLLRFLRSTLFKLILTYSFI